MAAILEGLSEKMGKKGVGRLVWREMGCDHEDLHAGARPDGPGPAGAQPLWNSP